MHTTVRFLTALRLNTDQETLEKFVIKCLRSLLDEEDSKLKRILKNLSINKKMPPQLL